MILLVQTLQVLSGILWLLPAVYLSPRIAAAFRGEISRNGAIFARNAFLSWLMAGYVVRWLAWPGSMAAMTVPELTAWAALYVLSSTCAVWFLRDAIAGKHRR